MTEFQGFGAAAMDFLAELEANNERGWFQANKHRYEDCVLGPALDFIARVGDRLPEVSEHFVAIPRRSGGSLMRVYRDTRFSKDKTPYKTNIGIQFRHEQGKDVHAPGFYFHLDNHECFLGVGMWRPDKDALAAIRDAIVERGPQWERARDDKSFRAAFGLAGTSLKRPPLGYPPDHPCVEDLKRKDFIAVKTMDPGTAASPHLPDEVVSMFDASRGFMRFLCQALSLPF